MSYPNTKVQALVDGHISIDSTWTEADFLDLALAALDQGGVSAMRQSRVAELLCLEPSAYAPEPEDRDEVARRDAYEDACDTARKERQEEGRR